MKNAFNRDDSENWKETVKLEYKLLMDLKK
jgi:hypothetical protein